MMKPMNVLIVQIYAPCEDEEEEEKDQFYEALDQTLKEYKKGRECLVVMGDFNGKVGNGREENIIGPYGLGTRNENGERLISFCKKHNLFVTNTWFQQNRTAIKWDVNRLKNTDVRDTFKDRLNKKIEEG